MSEARNPEQQAAQPADDSEISDESLEAVSGGLSLYGSTPGGIFTPPVTKPGLEPNPGDPILIVNEPGIIIE